MNSKFCIFIATAVCFSQAHAANFLQDQIEHIVSDLQNKSQAAAAQAEQVFQNIVNQTKIRAEAVFGDFEAKVQNHTLAIVAGFPNISNIVQNFSSNVNACLSAQKVNTAKIVNNSREAFEDFIQGVIARVTSLIGRINSTVHKTQVLGNRTVVEAQNCFKNMFTAGLCLAPLAINVSSEAIPLGIEIAGEVQSIQALEPQIAFDFGQTLVKIVVNASAQGVTIAQTAAKCILSGNKS